MRFVVKSKDITDKITFEPAVEYYVYDKLHKCPILGYGSTRNRDEAADIADFLNTGELKEDYDDSDRA